jgi:hypothetical protein
MKRQLAAGTTLLVAGASLMVYTVYALYGLPFLCALVMAWLTFVQYAVSRAWWQDVQEVRATIRRTRQ